MKKEDILLKIRPAHRSFILEFFLIFIILSAIYIIQVFGLFLNPIGLYAAIGFSIIIIIYVEFVRYSNTYFITKNQLQKRHGIISKKIESIFFENISEINLSQNLFQRIIGYGDVIVNSQASNQLSFKKIANPKKIRTQIEKLKGYQK